uniref:AAA+ ATPase domain-containing protein n=1 Tax=Bicosoecida sp. CB-2014 TaxID=1486930 RepID=A0A7S1C372_9STRA
MADVAFQEEAVRTLQKSVVTGNLPHLLFYGPPGTGKTSTILALAHEVFGPMFKERVLELNASDERGIAVVRDKVKSFAQAAVGTGAASKAKGFACPPFKIIVLDEADSLTADAQSALRRTMETYSKQTRFCLICNYVSRIIEPLASRCAKFRFKPLDTESMTGRLTYVADAEGVTLADDALPTLLRVSGGDLRKAITLMQSAAEFYGGEVSGSAVTDIAGVLPDDVIDKLWTAIRGGSFDALSAEVRSLVQDGYAVARLLERLCDDVVSADAPDDPDATAAPRDGPLQLSDDCKARMCECLAAADKQLIDAADEELQLLNVAATLQRCATGRLRDDIDKGPFS